MVKLTGSLPDGRPNTLTYAAGNFGQPTMGSYPDLPQQLLIWGQWFVLGLGTFVFVFAGPRERRFPRSVKGWIFTGLGVVGIGVCGIVGYFLYNTPTLSIIAPEQIAGAVIADMPKLDSAKFRSPEHAALVKRGQYLYKIISCNNCHGQKWKWGTENQLVSCGNTLDPQFNSGSKDRNRYLE